MRYPRYSFIVLTEKEIQKLANDQMVRTPAGEWEDFDHVILSEKAYGEHKKSLGGGCIL